MPLAKHLKTLIDYRTVADSDLVNVLHNICRQVISSHSHDARSIYEVLQAAHYVANQLPTARRAALIPLCTRQYPEAALLLAHGQEITTITKLFTDLKQKLGSGMIVGMHMHYLSGNRQRDMIAALDTIAAMTPTIVTRTAIVILFGLLATGEVVAKDDPKYKAMIINHCGLDEYDEEFRNNLFKEHVKGNERISDFIIRDHPQYSVGTARLIASLLEDSASIIPQSRVIDTAIEELNMNATAILLDEHFKAAELGTDVTVESISKIIRRFSTTRFNSTLSLLSRLNVSGETVTATIHNIIRMYTACSNTRYYHYGYSNNTEEHLAISLMDKPTLTTDIVNYKNYAKLSKNNEFTINTVNTGFVTQGKLEEVISIYRSRYWVEYAFFLRGLVGTLTDDEVYWALTHTTNSNIQQGAMLFMRTMMKYHIKSVEEFAYKDLTATRAVISVTASAERIALSKVLEDNYPLSYSMYAVFAEA